ncbi:hypothetical protein JH06_4013 [Blastocystis sp. subtype 4]|uniref:hypothetical protein n=1 Tax=Blastocystis sp. subtype 4 TaxID=944170 RepID=UPI000711C977|nr:hypothetical protein JH06_4013 [Blastocystis sp. subtype 4]KNB44507.1 hypothetical protein JH06_4013 [Blastocystis sp. subtype 4]|eukprot:XP_014527954.1 hypothetical protein JH06_4013 [Blastocystis sp. subtype 4]
MFSRACSQATRMTSRVIRSNGMKNVIKRHNHDHAGTPPPPYVQRRAPTKSLSEHAELIWEDGVAPETAIDFDAQNVMLFFLLWEGVKHYDPPHLARCVPRQNPKEVNP